MSSILYFVTFLISINIISCQTRCPTSHTSYKNGCYYFYCSDILINWYKSEQDCVQRGSHLISIHSDEENTWLNNFSVSECIIADKVIIGLEKNNDNVWSWIGNEEELNYTFWMVDEPNDEYNVSCMNVTTGEWLASDFDEHMYVCSGFFCTGNCSNHGICISSETCYCDLGWIGDTCGDICPYTDPHECIFEFFFNNSNIGYYPLNLNVKDYGFGTSKIHGTNYGAKSNGINRFGEPNTAYIFNRTSEDYIDLGDTAQLKPVNGISVSVWFKTTNLLRQTIFRKTMNGYGIWTENHFINLRVYHSSGNFTLSSTQLYDDNKWHHIVGTYDIYNGGKLYYDGILVDERRDSSQIYYREGGIAIGREGDDGIYYFDGSIDDVSIYDRFLYEREICVLHLAKNHTVCNKKGKCSKSDRCSCEPEYSGITCDICNEIIFCNNQGIDCKNIDGLNKCTCNAGYSGLSCEICNGTIFCNNQESTCVNTGGETNCTCKNDYTGDSCQTCPVTGVNDVCNTQGSTCLNIGGVKNCTCKNDYTGDLCEICPISGSNDVCNRKGTSCTNVDGLNNCTCNNTGYSGNSCEVCSVDDFCNSHADSCTNSVGVINCYCSENYFGDTCLMANCSTCTECTSMIENSKEGEMILLIQDLSMGSNYQECIIFDQIFHNITFDCLFHKISSFKSWTVGVIVDNSSFVEVKNCYFENSYADSNGVGISVEYSSQITINKNHFEVTNYGILVQNSNDIQVIDNTLIKQGEGITFINCTNNILLRNKLENVKFNGIGLVNSNNSFLNDNYICFSKRDISLEKTVIYEANNNTCSSSVGFDDLDSTGCDHSCKSIPLCYCSNIDQCTYMLESGCVEVQLDDNVLDVVRLQFGNRNQVINCNGYRLNQIMLLDVEYITVKNCILIQIITIERSSHLDIINNTFGYYGDECNGAVEIYKSNNVNVFDNQFTANAYGVNIDDGKNHLISNNVFEELNNDMYLCEKIGVRFYDVVNSIVCNNSLIRRKFVIKDSHKNEFKYNFVDNLDDEIDGFNIMDSSSSNIFLKNNLKRMEYGFSVVGKGSDYNQFLENIIINADFGFLFSFFASHSLLYKNHITSSLYGISLGETFYNNFTYNFVCYNKFDLAIEEVFDKKKRRVLDVGDVWNNLYRNNTCDNHHLDESEIIVCQKLCPKLETECECSSCQTCSSCIAGNNYRTYLTENLNIQVTDLLLNVDSENSKPTCITSKYFNRKTFDCQNNFINGTNYENVFTAIHIDNNIDVEFSDCKIEGVDENVIFIEKSELVRFSNIEIVGGEYGIYIIDSILLYFMDIKCDLQNVCGIWSKYNEEMSFEESYFTNSKEYGIYMDYTYDSIFKNCDISYNKYGIWVDDSRYNTFHSNFITHNIEYGIRLDGSYENLIYNNFFNNSSPQSNAFETHVNKWYLVDPIEEENIVKGPWIAGNFWSDYPHFDKFSKFYWFGEIPFKSYENLVVGDIYPLIQFRILPLVILTSSFLIDGYIGFEFIDTFVVEGGMTEVYNWEIIDSDLPNTFIFSQNANNSEISYLKGTFDGLGGGKTFSFTLKVTNGEMTTEKIFYKDFKTIGIYPTSLVNVVAGESFIDMLSGNGGSTNYQWFYENYQTGDDTDTKRGFIHTIALPNNTLFISPSSLRLSINQNNEGNLVIQGNPTIATKFKFFVYLVDVESGRFVKKLYQKNILVGEPKAKIRIKMISTPTVIGRESTFYIFVGNLEDRDVSTSVMTLINPFTAYLGSNVEPEYVSPQDDKYLENIVVWKLNLTRFESRIIVYYAYIYSSLPPNIEVSFESRVNFDDESYDHSVMKVNDVYDNYNSKCGIKNEAADKVPNSFYRDLRYQPYNYRFLTPEICSYHVRMMRKTFDEEYKYWIEYNYIKIMLYHEVTYYFTFLVRPKDPNEKLALNRKYVRSDETIEYSIHFENIGNTSALNIFLTDNLTTNSVIDYKSGVEVYTPEGFMISLHEGETKSLFKQEKNITVGVLFNITIYDYIQEEWNVSLDYNGILKWNLLGINLEPNHTDHVNFQVKLVSNLTSGTEIINSALIQFEIFEIIKTNDSVLIVDDIPPLCNIERLENITYGQSLNISWVGYDEVGEISHYIIYADINSTGYFVNLLEVDAEKQQFSNFLYKYNENINFDISYNNESLFINDGGNYGDKFDFICVAYDTAGNFISKFPISESGTTLTRFVVIPTDDDDDDEKLSVLKIFATLFFYFFVFLVIVVIFLVLFVLLGKLLHQKLKEKKDDDSIKLNFVE